MEEMIVYIANKLADDPKSGATTVNKALFKADFGAYAITGSPISGMAYFRLKHGPAPRQMVPIRHKLENARAITVVPEPTNGGYTRHRLVPLREADMSAFTIVEIRLLDYAIEQVRGKMAKTVSRESHGWAWGLTELQEDIAYELALLSDEKPDRTVKAKAKEIARRVA